MRKIKSCLAGTAIGLVSAGAFFIAAPAVPAMAKSPRPVLSAQQCQPLSAGNFAICCVALNRGDILSAAELDQCPPLTTSLNSQRDRVGRALRSGRSRP